MPKSQSPDLSEVLLGAIENAQSRIWTALPARVESYDAARQRCAAFPLCRNIYYNESEERVAERLPVIPDVPVLFQGCGAYRLTFPVAKGDLGLLVFTSCSLDKWLAGDGREVDPVDERRNDLSDAIFLPGLFARPTPTSAPTTAMVLHAASLLLGGPDATDPVVRKSDLDAVVSRLESHTHLYSPGTEAATQTGAPDGSFSSPACSPTVRSK